LTPHYKVRLGGSPSGAIFIVAAAGASLALALSIPISPWVRTFTILWIGALALEAYPRSTRAGREIALSEGEVEVTDPAGKRLDGRLRKGCFVSPWLTTIRWRPSGTRFDRTILVLPDMLAEESFRELRVWLRVG